MKINGRKLATSIVLILTILSCSDKNLTPLDIKGEWKWVETIQSGIVAIYISPKSEGYSKKLIIDEFTYSEYTDNELVLKTGYELEITGDSTLVSEEWSIIRLDSGEEACVRIFETGLQFKRRTYDSYLEFYKRD